MTARFGNGKETPRFDIDNEINHLTTSPIKAKQAPRTPMNYNKS
jgi:hypothetical protein